MNARAIIPLVAGLGIGGLALKLGFNVLHNAKAGQNGERVQVWGARAEIPRGTEIEAEMLQVFAYPSDIVPPGAFREKDKLVGRVARLVVPAELPVLDTMLAPPNSKGGVYPKSGFRAIAVKIDESSGVDYHLEPGCFIDVIGSNKNGRADRATAKTIVENVEVAAVGERISPDEKSTGEGKKDTDKGRPVRAVTLYVRPDQAKKILLAEQEGPIKLCLRGGTDLIVPIDEGPPDKAEQLADENADSTGSTVTWLQGLMNRFKPAAPPESKPVVAAAVVLPTGPEPWLMRIYRGNDRETVQFKSRDSRERLSEQNEPTSGGLFGNHPRSKTTGGPGTSPVDPPVTKGAPPASPPPAESDPAESPASPPEVKESQE